MISPAPAGWPIWPSPRRNPAGTGSFSGTTSCADCGTSARPAPRTRTSGVPPPGRVPAHGGGTRQAGGMGTGVVSVGVTAPQHRADLFLEPGSDPREGGPRLAGEKTTLAEFLRYQRLTLQVKCDGLDAG